MTALFLAICLAFSQDGVTITESSDRQLTAQVNFSQINKRENVPFTRFIISEQKPTFSYQVTSIDSVTAEPTQGAQILNPVNIDEPILIGSSKLYPVIIHPAYFNGENYIHIQSIEITTYFAPDSRALELPSSLAQVFDNLVLNYTRIGNLEPAGYLIIAPDAFIDELAPLTNWKEKKGWHVEVRPLSQTGSSAIEIRNYIANAYNTWSPRPEYVLLVGDVNYIPAASSTPSLTDHPYTLITGDDFFSEVLIGRLPAATELELNTMVAKIVGYETDPYMSNTAWFQRSLMVGANVPVGLMTTPLPTKRWVRERLLEYGFNTVDTVFFPMPASDISSSINQGVVFVNYRSGDGDPDGWPYPNFRNDDVNALNNGWMLPIVTSITCFTGHFGYNTCFGEAWLRAGNPLVPKGAVGFFGSASPSTHSRWNNCLDFGIYWAFVRENISDLGPALYRGKMEVYASSPGDTSISSGSSFYFHSFNLLGDPSLSVWTGVPDTFIVTHNTTVPVGTNGQSVQVNNSASQPVEGAMVSLFKQNEVKEIQFTDVSGHADFNFTTATQDTLFVTVTKHNFRPYQRFCLVNNSPAYVGYYSHNINDPGGNNNGEVNPGETIELSVTLKNYGNSAAATNVSARLSTSDPLITVTDSIKSYGSINPGATASAAPFFFNVSTHAKNGHVLKFNLNITSSQGNWTSSVWITVKAPDFKYRRNQIQDGNGILEPGETRDMTLTIKNIGGLAASNVSGILGSFCDGVVVTDSLGYFGSVAIGDSSTNSSDRFTLSAATSIATGRRINLVLKLSGDNGFADTLGFHITVGVVDSNEPLGPDDHGYYAYDDTDNDYPERPTYNWIEVDPAHGGSGDTLGLADDETKTIALPFNFKFYGNWYNQISICSNGYITMGSTWIADMYNWHIPGAGGPPLVIAPFWDNLDPNATDSSGNVCYWHDAASHRFVVEYSRVQHLHNPPEMTIPAKLQTFEVILYDPQHYPTETGDGEMIFQYADITNDDSWHNYATVGIENYDHTIGIEYTYADFYPDAAAPLANNRAIKFTTDPPDTFHGVSELKNGLVTKCWLNISPNPFTGITDIRYQISDTGHQKPGLKVYDVGGRLIRDLSDRLSPIGHPSSVKWDGTDYIGKRVPEGVYFVRLQNTHFNVTKKVILIE